MLYSRRLISGLVCLVRPVRSRKRGRKIVRAYEGRAGRDVDVDVGAVEDGNGEGWRMGDRSG
jgi:hypothetical protein